MGWAAEGECIVVKCVSGCDRFSASATLAFLRLPIGLDVQKDSGATYIEVKGRERFCSDEKGYCS
jgi:hypothetical protein